MKVTSTAWIFLVFWFVFVSCLNNADTAEPTIIIEPDPILLIASDTINTGSYLGFTIGETAEHTYTSVTDFKASADVTYLNVVSNIFSGMNGLKDKLPLYHLIFLDEKKGTDSGVQISIKDGHIKSIYLNSGKKLDKWPSGFKSSAIRTGDKVETLYEKLKGISGHKSYKNKFEYVNLITKDLSKNFDPDMANSPQWYFAYTIEADKMDEVKLNIKVGILERIIVNHYRTY